MLILLPTRTTPHLQLLPKLPPRPCQPLHASLPCQLPPLPPPLLLLLQLLLLPVTVILHLLPQQFHPTRPKQQLQSLHRRPPHALMLRPSQAPRRRRHLTATARRRHTVRIEPRSLPQGPSNQLPRVRMCLDVSR